MFHICLGEVCPSGKRSRKKNNDEKAASGIEVDEQTQLEQPLENIMEKMDEYGLKWTKESEEVNTKAEKEKAAAEDVRKGQWKVFQKTKEDQKQTGMMLLPVNPKKQET